MSAELDLSIARAINAVDWPISLSCLRTLVWVFDLNNEKILYGNNEACEIFQVRAGQDLKKSYLSKLILFPQGQTFEETCFHVQATGEPACANFLIAQEKDAVKVEICLSALALPAGGKAVLCEAISQTRPKCGGLRSAEALKHTDAIIMIFRQDGELLFANAAAYEALRAPRRFSQLFADDADHTLMMFELDRADAYRALARWKTCLGLRWFDVSSKIYNHTEDGEPAILVTATDVTELKNARDQAKYYADHDQLTGCFNRHYLKRYFSRLAALETEQAALVYFDLDHFKEINDQYGHAAGDAVLKEVSERMRSAGGENDIVVRLGGDEFVAIFPRMRSEEDLTRRMEVLLSDLSRPVDYNGVALSVSASMGAVFFSPRSVQYDEVLRDADTALYQSKRDGRGRFTLFKNLDLMELD